VQRPAFDVKSGDTMAYRIRRQAGDETNHFLLVAGRFLFSSL